MASILLRGGRIVSADRVFEGSVAVGGDRISKVFEGELPSPEGYDRVVELCGRAVFAGGIDPHVHFREPGMTHKADIESESRAALLGGVTSFIDMPNNNPPATTPAAIRAKLDAAAGRSFANYSFHYGVTNSNMDEIEEVCSGNNALLSPGDFAGLKVFMGSSTGNMLVNDGQTIERVFALCGQEGRDKGIYKRMLVHCEDEMMIREGLEKAKQQYGPEIPFREHPVIRSRMACIKSSMRALELAMKHMSALELCHISTFEEMEMCRAAKYTDPLIASETSPNYLWFSDEDYDSLGSALKCNPAVKTAGDRQALRNAFADGTLDIIGTDHAPHLPEEKAKPYLNCPSGLPSIQQSLPVLLTLASECDIPLERVAAVFSANPARAFAIKDRGMVEEGCYADLVVVDTDREWTLESSMLQYKCGWSPYTGCTFRGHVDMVLVNGNVTVDDGCFCDSLPHGLPLEFTTMK
ncbi:MAG: amidohydrolase family protein [Bacteroidales bacterium]|nr:amidohydrolase family protein [Bacteroidales bacterium]